MSGGLTTPSDEGNAVNVVNWKIASGAKWDVIVLGDSNTANMGDQIIEPWPHRHWSVLQAGLPGNGVNPSYSPAHLSDPR
jgi:hypothetical protein